MKNSILISIISLLFIVVSYAQTDTIWFDNNWQKTSKKDAQYFRTNTLKQDKGYWFTDYYISGKKQMEGLSLEKDTELYDGKVKWYYENNKLFQIVNYKKGVLHGKRSVFYETGNLKSETNYAEGKIHGELNEYYDNKALKETGIYKNDKKEGLWKSYYPNSKLKEEGNYSLGLKIDEWKSYHYDGSKQE